MGEAYTDLPSARALAVRPYASVSCMTRGGVAYTFFQNITETLMATRTTPAMVAAWRTRIMARRLPIGDAIMAAMPDLSDDSPDAGPHLLEEPVLQALDAMAAALETEIDAVRARGDVRSIRFQSGVRERTVAGVHHYRLFLPRPPGRIDAVTVSVVVGGVAATAELLDVDEREVTVATGRSLGDAVGGGTIDVDPSAVLEATLFRLGEVEAGERDLDPATLLDLLGLAVSPPDPPEPAVADELSEADAVGGDLDPFQADAVAAAVTGPCTFVWGPPGTGKTRTLGRLAARLVDDGCRVLLVAHAHVAVDAAVLAALAGGCRHVRRIGPPQLAEVPAHVVADRGPDADRPGLVAATLSKVVVSDDLCDATYDHVLVDEASMAQLPQVVLAAGLAPRVSVFGDVRQLPPVVTSGDDDVGRWLGRDVFETAGVTAAIESGAGDARLHLLRRQYRSHPAIAAVTNEFAYGGRLESAPATAGHVTLAGAGPAPGVPVVLWDTATLAPVAVRPGRSRLNVTAAVLVARCAADAVAAGPALTGGDLLVGVATPYVEQMRLLRALLDDLGHADDVVVQTVHRFQGGERELMIVDLCDGAPLSPPPFLRDDEGLRLLNVAMSRARSKLVVVGDRRWLARGMTGRAMHAVAAAGTVVAAAGTDGLEWMGVEVFLQRCAADIAAARDRVLVRAPRLQRTPLTDALGLAAKVCGTVDVLTDARIDPALAAELEASGVTVEVGHVDDRLVVADGVVYTGNTMSPAARAGLALMRVEAHQFARRLTAVLTPGR